MKDIKIECIYNYSFLLRCYSVNIVIDNISEIHQNEILNQIVLELFTDSPLINVSGISDGTLIKGKAKEEILALEVEDQQSPSILYSSFSHFDKGDVLFTIEDSIDNFLSRPDLKTVLRYGYTRYSKSFLPFRVGFAPLVQERLRMTKEQGIGRCHLYVAKLSSKDALRDQETFKKLTKILGEEFFQKCLS